MLGIMLAALDPIQSVSACLLATVNHRQPIVVMFDRTRRCQGMLGITLAAAESALVV
jgi:hypothetical protein